MTDKDSGLDSLKAYRARAAFLLDTLDDTESDLGSILVQTQDLILRARKGFESERVNMKSENGGVSTLNEAMPNIEVQCLQIKIKINELLIKTLTAEEPADTGVTVVFSSSALEDALHNG